MCSVCRGKKTLTWHYSNLQPDFLHKASQFHKVISISDLFYLLINEKKVVRLKESMKMGRRKRDKRRKIESRIAFPFTTIGFLFHTKPVKFNKLKNTFYIF
ncbi:hypothetical protein ILYODFUR_030137 [Ilyodon furcidens]|uniref:Uncharacterized protein n=1 Tax=Ilyodon furcidens TaxID=33524 RepID=A0ABV0UZK2_9TELE